ncbi:hypothetical protein KAI87_15235 [Myxococcota bacterium]|nr:hypothetical protein [Myxococcota bacterium]
MGFKDSYNSYSQFRRDMVIDRNNSLSVSVEEMADEMYHTRHDNEFQNLWDSVDDEE